MKLLSLVTWFAALVFSIVSVCAHADEEGITVEKLSDKVIIVSMNGFATQTAIATEKGIVVIDNVWSAKSARRYREAIEKEFGRKDFIYVIAIIDDLMNVGGNCIYPEAVIVAHEELYDSLKAQTANLAESVEKRAKVFDVKVRQSDERLKELEPGSDDYKGWDSWRNLCRRLADELRDNYTLALPSMTFDDRLSLDLGDVTLNLIYFGASDFTGSVIIQVPEERLLTVGASFHEAHLSPTLRINPGGFDVPRWLDVLGEVLYGGSEVKHVVTSYAGVWDKERFVSHCDYLRRMWQEVNAAIESGSDLETAQKDLSLDGKFSYIKEWDIYKRNTEWATEEHQRTLRYFWTEAQKRQGTVK